MLSAQLKHQRGFSPTWLVCVVTQDYRTYIHPSSWVEKESKHAYTAFKRKLREREDTAKAFKQDWFCVGIYPTMEGHIYFFSHNYVLFRWKAQRGNFRRPVPELSECSQNQMSWSLSPRTMDTYTFTLHRWTIRSGWLGKLTVRFHTHRFNQHRWCSSVVLATEKTQIWVDPHASKPFCSRVSCFYMWQVLGEKQPLNSPKPCSVTCCP